MLFPNVLDLKVSELKTIFNENKVLNEDNKRIEILKIIKYNRNSLKIIDFLTKKVNENHLKVLFNSFLKLTKLKSLSIECYAANDDLIINSIPVMCRLFNLKGGGGLV